MMQQKLRRNCPTWTFRPIRYGSLLDNEFHCIQLAIDLLSLRKRAEDFRTDHQPDGNDQPEEVVKSILRGGDRSIHGGLFMIMTSRGIAESNGLVNP